MKKKKILAPLVAVLLAGVVMTGCNNGDSEEKTTPAPTGDNEIDVSDWFSESADTTASPVPTADAEMQAASETPAQLLTGEPTPDVSAGLTSSVTPEVRLTEAQVTSGENTPTPTGMPAAQITESSGLETNSGGGQAASPTSPMSPTATPNPQDEGWLDGWY